MFSFIINTYIYKEFLYLEENMLKKVLIVSESSFRRHLLSNMLSSKNETFIVKVARNSQDTINLIKRNDPDVILLDVEFDNKEWVRPFDAILKKFKIPTIIITDVNPKDLELSDMPLFYNSYDYVLKPSGIWKDELPKIKKQILSKLLMVKIQKTQKFDVKARLRDRNVFLRKSQKLRPKTVLEPQKFLFPEIDPKLKDYFHDLSSSTTQINTNIVVIGASVGGPRTLRTILSEIPHSFSAPILVVQHLNHLFIRQFVTSLKSICKMQIKMALNDEEIKPGMIYIAPGDKHMHIIVKNLKPCIKTVEGPPVNYCRPSVDVLFYSAARIFKKKTLGILLTGMGRDGVAGLQAIKAEGGKTIAESEETSILYGMPKVAAETGAADFILPSYEISSEITKFSKFSYRN